MGIAISQIDRKSDDINSLSIQKTYWLVNMFLTEFQIIGWLLFTLDCEFHTALKFL